jgi:hypothetical protein
MERHFTNSLVLCTLTAFTFLCAYADILPPERTTLGKIDLAYENGELSYDYAVTYKYLALFGDNEGLVPAVYKGDRLGSSPLVSGTSVILELGRVYPSLRPELKTMLEEHCGIGGAADGALYGANGYRIIGNGDSSYGGYGEFTYDTPEGNFKVHWVKEGPDALEDTTDDDNDGVPDIVEWYGEDYELSFGLATGLDRYGFVSRGDYWMLGAPGYEEFMPLRDYYPDIDGGWPGYDGPDSEYGSDFGGDDRWDIYIIGDFGSGGGGALYVDQAFPFTSWYDYTGYFAVPNSYFGDHLDPESGGGWNTTVLSAHQFAHLMQLMHDAMESSPSSRGAPFWYHEATAGYFEYTCFGSAENYFAWAGSYLGDPLNSVEDPGDGGYLLNLFLEDWVEKSSWRANLGDGEEDRFVPEVWRALTGPGDPWYTGDPNVNREAKEAIGFLIDEYNPDEVYAEGRAFKDTYEIFTKWNWFTGARDDGNHYVYGSLLPAIEPSRTHDAYPVEEPTGVPYVIDHLGSAYFRFENLPDWGAGVLIYEASDENHERSRDWAGHICVLKDGIWQSLEGQPGDWSDMLSPRDIGIIQIPDPDRYEAFVFCLANTSYTGYDLDYAYYFSETTDVDPPGVTMAPVRAEVNPDYVEVLVGSNEELFGVPVVYATYTPAGEGSTKVEVEMTDEGGGGMSFNGTVVLPIGFAGAGVVEYAAADLGGNIVRDTKQFSAGTLAAGGGTVGDGNAYLRAPSGAFKAPTLVTIFEGEAQAETPVATGLTAEGSGNLTVEEAVETVGTSYAYGPEWANLGAPVSVILSYEGLDVTKENYLSVYQWNGSGWTDLGGTIDRLHKRVTAEANALGEFILGYGDRKEGDGGGFVPTSYALYQSYPNPAGTSAKVKYALPEDTKVTIKLYNIAGQVVKVLVNEDASAGTYVKEVSADGLANGVYLYKMEAGDYNAVKKMVVTR